MTAVADPQRTEVREQRLVFGEDPELYEKARAGYPESLVDDVLAFVGFDASQVRALEVGAGTGKAARSFSRRGSKSSPWSPARHGRGGQGRLRGVRQRPG